MAEHYYEKLDENLNKVRCPMDDKDGSISGEVRIGLSRWFDENLDERIRLGWTKHLVPDRPDFNSQTQYIETTQAQVDEWTVTDVYHVCEKSEDQLAFEEMFSIATGGSGMVWSF